eukprot:TRINITY_DN112127_c0_g1_i1.p1 TRINITY_DN112127_c0_g1~~TRINITY_DN112127_c0_g1_i1.p1  ORF type:complete len:292 (-),score=51.50 TRINITY_DN112127_c0_g1_i1:121-945(-)
MSHNGKTVGNRRPRRQKLAALAVCLGFAAASAYLGESAAFLQNGDAGRSQDASRREILLRGGSVVAGLSVASAFPDLAIGFQASDLGVAKEGKASMFKADKVSKTKDLEDAIYLLSRVQEATVQQERLVTTGKFKDAQRNSIKMALNMMLNNYQLSDNIVVASGFLETSKIQKASDIGRDSVEILQTAQEYFGRDLKVAGLSNDQRTFIIESMQACRAKIDEFLTLFPEDVVNRARKRVEDENALNAQEFWSPDGKGMLNPVELPWKNKSKKPV